MQAAAQWQPLSRHKALNSRRKSTVSQVCPHAHGDGDTAVRSPQVASLRRAQPGGSPYCEPNKHTLRFSQLCSSSARNTSTAERSSRTSSASTACSTCPVTPVYQSLARVSCASSCSPAPCASSHREAPHSWRNAPSCQAFRAVFARQGRGPRPKAMVEAPKPFGQGQGQGLKPKLRQAATMAVPWYPALPP